MESLPLWNVGKRGHRFPHGQQELSAVPFGNGPGAKAAPHQRHEKVASRGAHPSSCLPLEQRSQRASLPVRVKPRSEFPRQGDGNGNPVPPTSAAEASGAGLGLRKGHESYGNPKSVPWSEETQRSSPHPSAAPTVTVHQTQSHAGCTWKELCIGVYSCVNRYTYIQLYSCTQLYAALYSYTQLYVYMYMHICIYNVYVCVYICI